MWQASLKRLAVGFGQRRWLATSAQKRKWKNAKKGRGRPEPQPTENSKKPPRNWRAFWLLGVMPICMTGLVVMTRDDLRQDLATDGVGWKGIVNWRSERALEYERKKAQSSRDEGS